MNPRSLIGQLNGGICLGVAHALHQKLVYDPHYGLSLALYQTDDLEPVR